MSKNTVELDLGQEMQRLHDRISESQKANHKDNVETREALEKDNVQTRESLEKRIDEFERDMTKEVGDSKAAMTAHEAKCADQRLADEKRLSRIELRVNSLLWLGGVSSAAVIGAVIEHFVNR